MRQKLLSITQFFRLSTYCLLCNQKHHGPYPVCSFCEQQFIKLPALSCRQCAFPLPGGGESICGRCMNDPPYFDNTFIAYVYEEPLKGLLHRFKYQHDVFLHAFLSHLMHQAIPEHYHPLCFIPAPMHRKRLSSRGFNQAQLLASNLAKHFNVPCETTQIKKIRHTPPQTQLGQKDRLNNLKKAFSCEALPYPHVTLIDDLLTTGETANELAKTLKNAGAHTVDVWCCARALPEHFR